MKVLFFILFVITYLAALGDIIYFVIGVKISKINFKNLKDIIFKVVFPLISFILVISFIIFIFSISTVFMFIMFLLLNALLIFGISLIIVCCTDDSTVTDDDVIIFGLGLFLIAISLVVLLISASGKIDQKSSKKSFDVPLYATSDSIDRKTLLLNLTDEENGNLYISMEYDVDDTKGIELPFNFKDIDECKITKSSENKLVIVKNTITEINFYSYFGFKNKKTYDYDYYLYINEDNIPKLGN